jgi:hypothetical protein
VLGLSLKHHRAIERVLQYVGQKTWLCMGSVNKEWQSSYIMLYGAKETSCKQMRSAVRGGQLNMVQDLVDSGCPLHKTFCDDSVKLGHVDILRCLREHFEFGVNGGMCHSVPVRLLQSRPRCSSIYTNKRLL